MQTAQCILAGKMEITRSGLSLKIIDVLILIMIGNLRYFGFLSPMLVIHFFIYLNFGWELLQRIHVVWNPDMFASQIQEYGSKSPVLGKSLNWFELP